MGWAVRVACYLVIEAIHRAFAVADRAWLATRTVVCGAMGTRTAVAMAYRVDIAPISAVVAIRLTVRAATIVTTTNIQRLARIVQPSLALIVPMASARPAFSFLLFMVPLAIPATILCLFVRRAIRPILVRAADQDTIRVH